VCDIVAGIHGNEYRIDVCCQKKAGPLEALLRRSGVQVYCLDERGPRDSKAARRLHLLLRSQRYDILHWHSPVAASYPLLAAWLERVPNLICTFHMTPGPPAPTAVHIKNEVRRLLTASVSQRIDWIYACSGAVLKAQKEAGWRGRKSSVIYNGVDVRRLAPASDKASAKRTLDISADAPVIGTVGSLCNQKGHSHLIRAFPLIRARLPNARLLIVGSGPDGEHLYRLAQECGCSDAVTFLGERDDIAACMHAMDVFAFPSIAEGFGLAIAEAMACAIPVVASAVGGIPELVQEDVTGLLVPPGEHVVLADKILQLLTNPQTAVRLGTSARRTVCSQFSIDNMVSQTSQVYHALLTRRDTKKQVDMRTMGEVL
jgi:glycosyltransferase involved in cell wall biosynthesis